MLWGPYQTFKELVASDPRCSPANPLFSKVDHPGIGSFVTAASPVGFSASPSPPPSPSPRLGQHTDEVLQTLTGLSSAEIETLRAASVLFLTGLMCLSATFLAIRKLRAADPADLF